MTQSVGWMAGLGNPGRAYARARHNLGRQVLDAYAEARKIDWKQKSRLGAYVGTFFFKERKIYLIKPTTYMNENGISLSKCARYYQLEPERCLALYDDITLEAGRLKITQSGSSGGHKGVENVLEHIGDKFLRFRLGLGNKTGEVILSHWVLESLTLPEQALINARSAFYHEALEALLDNSCQETQSLLNHPA